MNRLGALFLLFTGAAVLCGQPYTPGETYFGANNYIEYQAGDTPIIITAPHGGSLTPSAIPNRANGTYNGVTYTDIVTVTDSNTEDLARKAAAEIFARTGKRPHLVICRLARTKLDANRDIGPAALGNALAEQAWRDYHGYIAAARAASESAFGFHYLVDLHGHGHSIQRLELGYGYAADLNLSDEQLNHAGYLHKGTLRTLPLRQPGVPFPTLLRGAGSFGDLFNRRTQNSSTGVIAIPAWPSPDFPSPGDNEFFSGGYTVQTHTCENDNGPGHGVQIECHSGVRSTDSNRQSFAVALARVLHIYLFKTYGYTLGAQSVAHLEAPAAPFLTRGGTPLTITATRTENVSLSSTIALAFSGTAVAGVDYTTSTDSLFFPQNESSVTFTVTPGAPSGAVGDRTLHLALAPSVTQTADTTPLTFTIGDGVSQTVRVHALAHTVTEADGVATFRFTRTQTASALTVGLAWGGTASAETDYHGAPAFITFAAGSATVDVPVTIVDDGRPEADKSLTVSLVPGTGFVPGAASQALVDLRDDDRPAGLALWLRGELAGNHVADSSGHHRHAVSLPADAGAISGPLAQTRNDAPALGFDGVDDTVLVPRFPVDPHGAFTVAFFFRMAPHPVAADQQALLGYGSRGNDGSLHVYLSSTTNLRTSLPSGGSTTLINTSLASPGWQDNTWRHYALSIDAAGTARVYIDGVLRNTVANARTGTLAAHELFWLGWRPVSGGGSNAFSFLHGGLSDFRVYQRALGVAELTALANNVQNYAAWLAQNDLAAHLPGVDDGDGDGFPALVEYGLAARPAVADTPPRYTVLSENGRLVLQFLRDTTARDLTWSVQASTELGTWQTLASRAGAAPQWTIHVAGTSIDEHSGFVRVADAAPLDAGTPRFLRLKIDLSP